MDNTSSSIPPSSRTGSTLGSADSTPGANSSTYSSGTHLGTGSMGGAGSGGASLDTRETVDRAQNAAHSTVDRLANTARGWAEKIDERTRGIQDVPLRAWDYSRSTVQEHPMQAVLLSMLVGYVIGRLSGGRATHYVEY